MRQPKRDVHGWVVLDKPCGMTSTHAVAVVKRLFMAKKAGHAGTLDPLATGVLPIALGEATKTVPFIMDSAKSYVFSVQFGQGTDTDDSEGKIIAQSDVLPAPDALHAVLPEFTGTLLQMPPQFSALKVGGERAYDLAREGQSVALAPREVTITRLVLLDMPDPARAVLLAECGKGTYVRALARDLGQRLGTFGHVVQLRRTRVGPFSQENAISLENLENLSHKALEGAGDMASALAPLETALDDIPALAVSGGDAGRLCRGQPVLLRGRDAPQIDGPVFIKSQGQPVAVAFIENGELIPHRVFNLRGGVVARPALKGLSDVDYSRAQTGADL